MKTIRILGKEIKVLRPKKLGVDLEDYGSFSLTNLELAVQDGIPKHLEKEVFIHEALHGIDQMLDLNLSEKQVNTIGVVLMQIFADNPEFLRYLAK